ncbi:MAG TPA: class I SAM-dependent methyltransferase [Parachlamydiaceae bacterium]|nr:class I SAM-dependent methyltransferase [Parachlamydiaceae bacterium]
MDNTMRFSDRVENYILYRPHYPPEIITFLKTEIGFNSHIPVADIGSGTGISSEIFLQNGNSVYAVEPNEEMRKAAEKIFHGNKSFISVNGTAEATTLSDNSIQLIVAGQAFHWFDKIHCHKEFQRIAVAGSYLLLMWNERKLESHFQQAYEKMLKEFGVDYEKVHHRNVDEKTMGEFFAPFSYSMHTFSNVQRFDFEGLKGRLLSSSFISLENTAKYEAMLSRLRQIFDEFSKDSQIEFAYHCKIYYGKIK